MKLFKTIYYSVIGVLVVLLFTLSCVDISGTKIRSEIDVDKASGYVEDMTSRFHSSSIYDSAAHEERVSYISSTLADMGLVKVQQNNESVKDKIDAQMANVPCFVEMKTVLSGAERAKWVGEYTGKAPTTSYMPTTLTNIVAYFPSKTSIANVNAPTSKVILFMAHYDSVSMGKGANDDLAAVAAMMETIRITALDKAGYDNDLMFVFTDGEEQGMLGAYALREKFVGFGNAYGRVGFASNYESRGTDGTVIMFESSSNNYNLINNWAKIRSGIFTSSVADFAYSLMPNYTDFAVLKNVPALNFANIGGGENYHTQGDNPVNTTLINSHGEMMLGLVKSFGNMNLDKLTGDSSGVFFSYLDIGVVRYPVAVAYVLAGLILALLIAVIVVNIFKKVLDWRAIGKGVAVQLIALVGAILVGFVAYYIFTGIFATFGVINIHSIATLMFSSTGLMIASSILMVTAATAFYGLFKRILSVKAGDVVRGNVLIWTLLALVTSFAAPAASYLFAFVALLELVVLLCTVIFKSSFKQKFAMDIDRLFLSVIPIVVLLPVFMGLFLLLGDALGTYMYPIIMALPVLYAGFIAPYFDYLKGVLDRFVKVLPSPTVRVYRTVTEKVEHTAKKGKYETKTYRKMTKEKLVNTYKSWHGLTAIAVVCSLCIILFNSFGMKFTYNISGSANRLRAFTDDALVYVIDKADSKVGTNYWMVTDLDAYRYIGRAVDGFKWNGDVKAYVKEDTSNTAVANTKKPTFTYNSASDVTPTGLTFTVKPNLINMLYSLEFSDASQIAKVVISASDNISDVHNNIEYFPEGGKLVISEIKDKASVEIVTVEGKYTGKVTFVGSYHAYLSNTEVDDPTELQNYKEWEDLKEKYKNKPDVYDYLKAAFRITTEQSFA